MKDSEINIELPISWIKTKVSEVSLRIHYGYTASTTNDSEGVKYLRITDIQGGNVNWHEVPYCEISESELDKFILNKNDIVFARTGGTVGKSFLLDKDFPFKSVFASYLIRIIPSTLVNAKFVTYYFQTNHYWNQIETNKVGLKTNVNAQVLGNIKFNLAPLPEQHRIVAKLDELFSELEKGKEQLELVQQKLKVYRQSLLKAAFEGKLTEEWRKQQPNLKIPQQLIDEINQYRKEKYEQVLKDYEDKNVKIKPKKPEKIVLQKKETKKIPSNWCFIRFGDLIETTSGGTPSRKNPSYFNGDIPWIKSGELNYNIIVNSEEKISEEALKNSSAKIFPKGTLLLALYGATIGKLAILGIPAATNQAVCGIFENEFYRTRFVYFYLLYKKEGLIKQAIGGAQPNISQTILNNIYIPLFTLDEQDYLISQIESKFSLIDNLFESIDNKIKSTESLKQSILQKAFSGQLVPQDTNDEPANVLLERIKKEREEYLKNQEKEKKTAIRKTKISMAEELKTIMQLLQESKMPMAAKSLWQASEHKENIDAFYAELKTLIESGEIKEAERKGKESYLTLADAK